MVTKRASSHYLSIAFLFVTFIQMKETPAQKIKRLERELTDEKLKNKVLNTMIDISDKQYGTAIRKKYSPNQSNESDNNKA